MTVTVSNRYTLYESLGKGSMGVVHRAMDQLTGEIIALKRVTVPGEQLQFASQASSTYLGDIKLALAQEFRTLASLRHPNIISVLDYGFDEHRQPYFTMNYLSDARTIVEAGEGQSVEKKVDLLTEVLLAMAYLHRRGILHRDLKPGNVLVSNGRVRVLDFGLSISREDAHGRAGTLAYMAPEILRFGRAEEASDLYAVGVLAYQLFSGTQPFDGRDILGILSRPPDLSGLEVNMELAAVVERLLCKNPSERYSSADATILALCEAIGQPPPEEAPAVRESFLQAAAFVGREAELERFMRALNDAMDGRGSAWLVGGESGVGKTRLLEELRIRALVKGAWVLRGQAVEGGGQPYHLWREPLRRLAFSTELSDLEAGVLKPILPDIGALLRREIPDAPDLDDKAAGQRLILNIAGVVRQAATGPSPLVLLLEDLHWSVESLEPLAPLSRLAGDVPLLIVATYRTEERPDLPDIMPDLHSMRLQRLRPQAIAELSASMLGEAGAQQQVLNLLHSETEGNAFFLVETVRALAEEAGRLQDIGKTTLPETVFAGGVKQIVWRRLERVPAQHHPLLKLAAIAGRALEVEVLQSAMPGANLEAWLTACADVAVIEVQEGLWRFAHDKFREALVDGLRDDERPFLHSQIAGALETTNASDLSPHYSRLVWHYGQAGDLDRERYYAGLAGEQAAAQYSNDEAVRFFSRALALTPENDLAARCRLLFAREAIYELQGKLDNRQRDLEMLQSLVLELNDASERVKLALRWTNYFYDRGDYPQVIDFARRALNLTLPAGELECAVKVHSLLSSSLARLGNLDDAALHAKMGLDLARDTGDITDEILLMNSLGMIAFDRRDLSAARSYFERGLDKALESGCFREQSPSLNNLGMVAGYQGDYQAAQAYYEQALAIARQCGMRLNEGVFLGNLGWIAGMLGEYEQARLYAERNLYIAREVGDPYNEAYGLINLSSYAGALGDYDTALSSAQQGQAIACQIGDRSAEAWALTNLGHSRLALGQLQEASQSYHAALDVRRELDQSLLATEPAAGLARVALAEGDLAAARNHLEGVLDRLDSGGTLDGTDEPLRVYLTCYLALKASGEVRADQILEMAYRFLQERAANIKDDATRRAFLENIQHNREILDAWEARSGETESTG